MAVAGNGSFLKGVIGSITNITMKGFRGETVISGKRAKGQSNPSEAFLQAQLAAKLIVFIYQRVAEAIRVGFTTKASNQSEYNAYYGYTYDNAMDLSDPVDPTIINADLLVARGLMTTTTVTTPIVASAGLDQITFVVNDEAVDDTQSQFDRIGVVVYNITKDLWTSELRETARGTGTLEIPIDPGFLTLADTLDVYYYFYGVPGQENSGTSSNSIHASVTVAA